MLTDLSALLDLLKANGVRTYEGPLSIDAKTPSVCIVFAHERDPMPAEPTHRSEEKPDAKQSDPDICSCGHGVHEHNNGLCLVGCDEGKCNLEAS